MVSFDVVSMFTKVPIQETLNFIEHRLRTTNEWKKTTKLEVEDLMDLLKICAENTYFTWRGGLFKQTEGSPMGSPISAIFAELFMEFLEESLIKHNSDIKFWRRFVDDTFSIIKSRKAKQILKKLNNFHPNIKFTMEQEINNSLPFLDVLIHKKEDGTLTHKIYRKPTHTNQYLHFESYHHPSQKIAVIDTLTTRALRLCDTESVKDELNFVENILKQNHYPIKTVKGRIEQLKQRTPQNRHNQQLEKWIALPYTGSMSKRLSKLLRNNVQVNIGYYTGTKLSSLLYNFKDKREKVNSGIYKIKCKQCPQVYIGESERNINKRLEEHESHIRNNRTNLSAVAQHMADNPGHEIDKASFGLLERETRYFHRKIKESLYIKKFPHTMNNRDGKKVNPIWIPTILPLMKIP
ncbi:hypothetical protein Fcan01_09800 [Folsomia candida]|uniref:Reverse transcriptase domain-containing protein n=1 Tax=Folsomia candida TaxID=158441 RepID=A0A226EG42_FOLCA|nr:hypothetical protein Fcan01_09800 [Folsomia candida]